MATDTKTDTQPIRMTCPQCLDAQTTIVVTIEKTTLEHGYPTDQYVEVTYRLYSSETHPRCLCVPSDRQYNDMVTKAIRQTRQTMGI